MTLPTPASREAKLARRAREDDSTSILVTALAEVVEQHRLELDELRELIAKAKPGRKALPSSIPRTKTLLPVKTRRDHGIRDMRLAGASCEDIAEEFGLTRSRVAGILKRDCVRPPLGT